jgi:hypothetical protein
LTSYQGRSLSIPSSAGRPEGRLAFPQGSVSKPRLSDGFRSAGWSGRPQVDLVTVPLLRRHVPVRAVRSSPGRPEDLSGLGWTPLMGFKDIAPPPIKMLCVHSQVGRNPPFGTEAPTSVLVPSLPFHPTPTVYSAQHLAGLLHPATGHGVRHVSGAVAVAQPEGCALASAPSSMAHTLRSFSLPGSCTVSPRSGPSRCWLPLVRTFCSRRRALSVRFHDSPNLRALSHQ